MDNTRLTPPVISNIDQWAAKVNNINFVGFLRPRARGKCLARGN